MQASLLVPCYNSARDLPRLWETIRAQKLAFSEVICYDDASQDNTAEVARSLGAKVIRAEQNSGPAHARNQLWRAAHYPWVHFHDADDLLHPDFLSTMASRATPEVDVLICDVEWVDEVTRAPVLHYRYNNRQLQADPLSYTIENPIGGINGLYRVASLDSIHGFDETLRNWEDADLHVRLSAQGARMLAVETTLCTALRRSTSCSTNNLFSAQQRLSALERYARDFPETARPAILRSIETSIIHFAWLKAMPDLRRVIAFARQLGMDPPVTDNPFLQVLKMICPATFTCQIQARMRMGPRKK